MPINAPSPSPIFAVSSGERDGLPAVAVINTALADYEFCGEFPWLVELEIHANETVNRGMPSLEEVDQLNAIEERLQVELSEAGGHFIARQTWNGRRMLDFYVADGPAARRRIEALVREGVFPRTVTVQSSDDRSWDTWMPTLIRMGQPTAECDAESADLDQAVLVKIPLRVGEFASDEEQEAVLELADALAEVVAESGVGEFDGYELGNAEAVLFAYGPDADTLLAALEPVLRKSPIARGASITKRYGPADDQVAETDSFTL